jgi:hypothetical protein
VYGLAHSLLRILVLSRPESLRDLHHLIPVANRRYFQARIRHGLLPKCLLVFRRRFRHRSQQTSRLHSQPRIPRNLHHSQRVSHQKLLPESLHVSLHPCLLINRATNHLVPRRVNRVADRLASLLCNLPVILVDCQLLCPRLTLQCSLRRGHRLHRLCYQAEHRQISHPAIQPISLRLSPARYRVPCPR